MMSSIRRPWVRPMCSEPTWFHQFGPSGFWPPPQYRSQLVHWVLGSLLIVVWFNGAFYSNMLCFKRGSCMLLDLPKFTVLPSTSQTDPCQCTKDMMPRMTLQLLWGTGHSPHTQPCGSSPHSFPAPHDSMISEGRTALQTLRFTCACHKVRLPDSQWEISAGSLVVCFSPLLPGDKPWITTSRGLSWLKTWKPCVL